MKRGLFLSLLIIQVAVILLIPVQHALIDVFGTEVKLLTASPRAAHYDYSYHRSEMYIDYDLNTLHSDIWEVSDEVKSGEKIYVIVEPDDDGIFHAIRATDEKPDVSGDQVILLGQYLYSMGRTGKTHEVEYGIEHIASNKRAEQLDNRSRWVITIHIAPWGQKSVVKVENEE